MEKTNDNYEPFGKEWESEMKKWPKQLLIAKIKELLISKKDLADRYNDLLLDNCD